MSLITSRFPLPSCIPGASRTEQAAEKGVKAPESEKKDSEQSALKSGFLQRTKEKLQTALENTDFKHPVSVERAQPQEEPAAAEASVEMPAAREGLQKAKEAIAKTVSKTPVLNRLFPGAAEYAVRSQMEEVKTPFDRLKSRFDEMMTNRPDVLSESAQNKMKMFFDVVPALETEKSERMAGALGSLVERLECDVEVDGAAIERALDELNDEIEGKQPAQKQKEQRSVSRRKRHHGKKEEKQVLKKFKSVSRSRSRSHKKG